MKIRRLLFGALFCLTVFSAAAKELTVVYVPGWQHKQNQENLVKTQQYLAKIFTNAEIAMYTWEESDIAYFPECRRKVDAEVAPRFVDHLTKKYAKNMDNVILVGHSLGGRTVIKAMAILAQNKQKIRCGIFLGSAISYDDPSIAKALTASNEKCINIFSLSDPVLRKVYGVDSNENAMGAYGYKYNSEELKQYKCGTTDHGVLNYLAELPAIFAGKAAEYRRPPEVKVLYAAPYTTKLIPRKLDIVDSSKQWKLVQKKQMFYIIDPDDRVRAWGSEKRMKESFDNIKEQLKK